MKKLKLFAVMLVTAIVGVFCLVACGETSQAGKYKFYSISGTEDGVEINLKVGDTYMGMISLSEDFMVIELKDDGSAVVTSAVSFSGSSESQTGTWKVNENDSQKVDITIEGETETFECDGKTLKADMEGMIVTLKK